MRPVLPGRCRVQHGWVYPPILFGIGLILGAAIAANAETPLDLIFVLDVSQNMLEPGRFVVAGAHLATFELNADDRVTVMSAGPDVEWHSGPTSDSGEIERAFQRAQPRTFGSRGKARLYDAAWRAIERFPAAQGKRRRFVILITNDADRGSNHAADELTRESKAKGVVIQAFLIRNQHLDPSRHNTGYQRMPYPDLQSAAEQLRSVTNPTGGTVSVVDMNGYVLRQAIAACKREGS